MLSQEREADVQIDMTMMIRTTLQRTLLRQAMWEAMRTGVEEGQLEREGGSEIRTAAKMLGKYLEDTAYCKILRYTIDLGSQDEIAPFMFGSGPLL